MGSSKEYFQEYYRKNKDKIAVKRKIRYAKDPKGNIAKTAEWRKTHPEQYRMQSQIARRKLHNHITRLWCAMNRRIKIQSSYKNRKVLFSKEWFREYCNNSRVYKKLFKQWEDSGYLREFVPTVDRIDNSKNYSKDNIQFLTFKNNSRKKYYDNRNLKFRPN